MMKKTTILLLAFLSIFLFSSASFSAISVTSTYREISAWAYACSEWYEYYADNSSSGWWSETASALAAIPEKIMEMDT